MQIYEKFNLPREPKYCKMFLRIGYSAGPGIWFISLYIGRNNYIPVQDG